jgi:hypothetical protein
VLSLGMLALLPCVCCATQQGGLLDKHVMRWLIGDLRVPLLLLLPGCRLMLGCSCSWSRRPTSGSLQATAAGR